MKDRPDQDKDADVPVDRQQPVAGADEPQPIPEPDTAVAEQPAPAEGEGETFDQSTSPENSDSEPDVPTPAETPVAETPSASAETPIDETSVREPDSVSPYSFESSYNSDYDSAYDPAYNPDGSPTSTATEPEAIEAPAETQTAVAPPPSIPPDAPEPDSEDEFEEERELGARMTFLEHLDELRKRILYSVAAMAVGFGACWGFRERIFHFIRKPIDPVVDNLVITSPTEAFTIYMKLAFVVGIFLSAPVILYQVWMFIAPGLYRKEKRFALPFLLSSTALFLLGGAFAYWIVLPPALQFLIIDFGKEFMPMITAMDYFDLVILIIVGMGAVFQLPVLIAFLSMFGMVTPRFLWRNFRYAFLLIVILAAVVSPTTDPFNLLLWTGPMTVLYLIGIVVSWVFKRRRARKAAMEAREEI